MSSLLLEVSDYFSHFDRSRNSKVRRSRTQRERRKQDLSAEKLKEISASSNQVNTSPYFQLSGRVKSCLMAHEQFS